MRLSTFILNLIILQKLAMDTRQTRVEILLFVITIFGLFSFGNAASAHIHSHQHNKPGSNERTEDGAFSPRDMDHYAGGEHHQEFDHEAILGIHFAICHIEIKISIINIFYFAQEV